MGKPGAGGGLMGPRGIAAVVALAVAVGLAGFIQWQHGPAGELRRLLGPDGRALAGGARLAAWQPDPDARPMGYYLQRRLDAAACRALATSTGLVPAPVPALAEAVWRLPAGLDFPGWVAPAATPGRAVQASGRVGQAVVWLRCYDGNAYLVVLPASP
ncbi:hypothetical protein EZJ19_09480 [Parasulfuritortus cantonensis]|uniref:Uncharacterized protein n=1 Tax=Parasulfuritortus cantonensis TaxID=2528202 RepID=A0A4R1BCI4_9PROT|nr:hypothetical protein [Parasulfuritortus cantonensis]TCJ14668.1 hypothetical protein EZJ19_09480 [Parasulfuritortus cantonensis]